MKSQFFNFQFRYSRNACLPQSPGFGCSSLWFAPFVDAIYDCSSLYQKNYRISGVYKLPPDDFLGSPELEVRSLQPTAHVLPSVLYPSKGWGRQGSS